MDAPPFEPDPAGRIGSWSLRRLQSGDAHDHDEGRRGSQPSLHTVTTREPVEVSPGSEATAGPAPPSGGRSSRSAPGPRRASRRAEVTSGPRASPPTGGAPYGSRPRSRFG